MYSIEFVAFLGSTRTSLKILKKMRQLEGMSIFIKVSQNTCDFRFYLASGNSEGFECSG